MSKRTVLAVTFALALGAGGGYWLAAHVGPRDLAAGLNDLAASAGLDKLAASVGLGDLITFVDPGEMEMAMTTPAAAEREPLFYRHPMNPEVTSPVPAKDEMGMDYVPVYPEEPKAERKPLFYRHPMNPEVTSPVPAKDEMGMDYVPVYAEEDAAPGPAGTVRIDPVMVQNIGVRTAIAERRTLSHNIRALGRVDYDEERLSRLHPKVDGWIEKLFISRTGDPVKKGTILVGIYSPQLVSSQEEYLLALENLRLQEEMGANRRARIAAQALVDSSRRRLEFLDVPEHQLKELEETGVVKKSLHIHSPFAGIVLKVGAREGQYVTARTELFFIADLSKVWVYVDVYEYELPWVRVGDKASMKVTGVPGRTFKGTVSYIYPYLEKKTRTAKVRLEFDNPDLALKPNMFTNVTIHSGQRLDAVVIPEEAVIRSGIQDRVFVALGGGKFEPREVTRGVATDGLVQILEGVKVGEKVVASGQFLIDSESSLREAVAKMMALAAPEAAGEGGSHGADAAAGKGGEAAHEKGGEAAAGKGGDAAHDKGGETAHD